MWWVLYLPLGDTPVHRLLFTDYHVGVTTAVRVATGTRWPCPTPEFGFVLVSHHGRAGGTGAFEHDEEIGGKVRKDGRSA